MINLDAAMTNPASQYAGPEALLADTQLTHDQKLTALRAWELDARQLGVADGEHMEHPESDGGDADLLTRVHDALRSLGEEPGSARQAPTAAGALAD